MMRRCHWDLDDGLHRFICAECLREPEFCCTALDAEDWLRECPGPPKEKARLPGKPTIYTPGLDFIGNIQNYDPDARLAIGRIIDYLKEREE